MNPMRWRILVGGLLILAGVLAMVNAVTGIDLGGFVWAALFVLGGMVLNWMIFSGGEITNDPPSTITQPGFIDCTISAVMSRGAGLPGIRAVVMIMSTSLACLAYISRWAFWKPSLITLA